MLVKQLTDFLLREESILLHSVGTISTLSVAMLLTSNKKPWIGPVLQSESSYCLIEYVKQYSTRTALAGGTEAD